MKNLALTATAMALIMFSIGVQAARCAPGKSYICGSHENGGWLICCDEWEPDTVAKPLLKLGMKGDTLNAYV